jgi:hypothetical protein
MDAPRLPAKALHVITSELLDQSVIANLSHRDAWAFVAGIAFGEAVDVRTHRTSGAPADGAVSLRYAAYDDDVCPFFEFNGGPETKGGGVHPEVGARALPHRRTPQLHLESGW